MHRVRRFFALLLALLLCASVPAPTFATQVVAAPLSASRPQEDGMVRVFLSSMGNVSLLDITVQGSYTAVGDAQVNLSSGDAVRIIFNKTNGNITMNTGGKSYDMGREMRLRRRQAGVTSGLKIAQTNMADNLYPGDLQLKAQLSGGTWRMYPIVHVYIEYYLHGVVPYEMGNSAPLEALKAQAVAARTYTLNKMHSRASSLYDVVDTTNDQVYYGNSDSTTRCKQAVDETKGIVITNNGVLTGTYYTASNGGQTESAYNRWSSTDHAYLKVKDDPFDLMNSASVYRKVTVYGDNTRSDQSSVIKSLLNKKAQAQLGSGATVTRINSITPHTPMYASPSRLYTKLDFGVTAAGVYGTTNLTLTCDIFSELETQLGMSINNIKNELWTVQKQGSDFILYARRFGHGIGMSQRGAMQMGNLGYTYDQILGFYYEGCTRQQYTFTHTILASLESGGSETITTTEDPAEISPSHGVTAIVKLVGVSDKLAIRSAASDSGSIITSVVNGGMVNVLAKMGSWTMIRLGSLVGYVPTSALTFTTEPPEATDATPTQITRWATVRASGTLNLRASGSTSASVVATMPNGAVLCVFSVKNGWAQVQYGASTGWASTDFLVMSDTYPLQTATNLSGAAVVSIPSGSGTVNLRETASTSARVLATLSNGTQITVTASDGSWCAVTTSSGTKGYVMADYVSYGSSQPGEDDSNTPSAPELGSGEEEAVVHTASGSLNLRAEPSNQAAVVASIPRGESIVVTSRGDNWCAVRYGSQTGYVATMYLRFPGDDIADEEAIAQAAVNTVSGSLNMRKQPALGSTVVEQIPRGAKVDILEKLESWCRVRYAGKIGFVMTSYLLMEGSSFPGESSLTATVSTPSGNLNLRETPSTSARVLASIAPGSTVNVISQGDEWSKITLGGYTGYVMTRYLDFGGSSGSGSASGGVSVSTGNGGGLNLRETASADARVLLVIPNGAAVSLLESGNEWSRVEYDGQTGYVMSKFLSGQNTGGNTSGGMSAGTSAATVATRNGGALNLRETASTYAGVLQSIPNGASVTLLEQGKEWCRVRYNGTEGYVMTQYLSIGQSGSSDTRGWIVTDITGGVNMRYMPDTSGQVLAVLKPGTEIAVTLHGSSWSVVRYDGQTGYVMSKYVTLIQPQTEEPSVPQTRTRYVDAPGTGLNLRSEPSTSGDLLSTIPHGSMVTVLADVGNGWHQVNFGVWIGYVSGDYLSYNAPEAEETSAPEADGQTPVFDSTLHAISGWEAIVSPASGNVNLRAWCATNAPVRHSMPKGKIVQLLEFGDNWCHVAFGEVDGYCMTQYLTLRPQY